MFLVQLIIFQIIIFAALIFALKYILTSNITKATSHLDELNADFIRREEEIKQRQAETEKNYQDSIAKTKNEIDQLRLAADKQIKYEHDRVLAAAVQQSEEIVAKAQKTREAMVGELKKEIEEEMSLRMREMIAKVFSEPVRRELHRIWLSDLLHGEASVLSHIRIPDDVREAKLTSAFVFSAADKDAFHKKFKELFKRDFSITDEVDPSLVAGVLITVGGLLLDGTVANRIQQVVHESI